MQQISAVKRVAIPVINNRGAASQLSRHFGKSLGFIITETTGDTFTYYDTKSLREAHECAPIQAFVSQGCQGLICHSMGKGALANCQAAGLQLFKASGGEEVTDVLRAFREGACELLPDSALCTHNHDHCGDHTHGDEEHEH